MKWNYRVVRREDETEDSGSFFAIEEVYYNAEGTPRSHTDGAAVVAGDREGLGWALEKMREALDKPVLDAENWPHEWKEPER